MNEISRGYLYVGIGMVALGGSAIAFGWPVLLAVGPLMLGFGLITTTVIMNGLPALFRSIIHADDPVWNGEILHTDGGDHKLRYGHDPQGAPWFAARDICQAIGEKAPGNRAQNWKGARLIQRNKLACFSGESVKKYLSSLATDNRDARRLLVLLQKQVIEVAERQREAKQRLTQREDGK
jgi:hypothetical protein